MTDEELKEIKARADAATPGPWEFYRYTDEDTGEWEHLYVVRPVGGDPLHWLFSDEWFRPISEEAASVVRHRVNMTFVAHARADIPALLAEVERLKAELAILKPLEITAREYSVGWATQSALCDEARRYALQQYKMTSRVA